MEKSGLSSLVANTRSYLFFALLAGCNNLVQGEPADRPPESTEPAESIDGLLDARAQRPQSRVRAATTAPPLSGGTLTVSRDGKLAVAGNPEADRLYFFQIDPPVLLNTVRLQSNTGEVWEPGRIVEGSAGQFAVVARSMGSILLFDRSGKKLATQRVCTEPRGLAAVQSKSEGELLYVACASGDLVKLQLADLKPLSVKHLPVDDLRDIVVMSRTQELAISRFRSSQILQLSAEGELLNSGKPVKPATITQYPRNFPGPFVSDARVARRLISTRQGEVFLLHQEHLTTPVPIYYKCPDYPNCPAGILPTLSILRDDFSFGGRMILPNAALALDVAVSFDGAQFLVVAAGNVAFPSYDAPKRGSLLMGNIGDLSAAGTDLLQAVNMNGLTFKPIAVAPLGPSAPSDFVVLTRGKDPSLYRIAGKDKKVSLLAKLDDQLPVDPGMEMFHAATPAGLTCASCHAEGGDDGHVWTRLPNNRPEARRTKSLLGGLLASAPFRWDGSHPDAVELSKEDIDNMGVRLSSAADPQVRKMVDWINEVPAAWPQSTWKDAQAQAAAGGEIFKARRCGSCHDNPKVMTSGALVIKVPRLVGVGSRAPYYHSGCAADLKHALDGSCAANDASGGSHDGLTADEQQQLAAYLLTL